MIKAFAKGANYLFGRSLKKNKVFISSSLGYLGRETEIDTNYFDYVRIASLELISFEIAAKKLSGNVAELGVYKGKFAKYINQYFSDRVLYLFDTFRGFDKRDILKETEEKFSAGEQNFSNTSVDSVLSLMPFPEKCIPVRGHFPESAKDIDDTFVFVSIDADLFEPIYSGLIFFYPKLVSGGYIFVHDFNNINYKGARKAVEKFCSEEKISYLPIPDFSGTAVIIKG